MEDRRFSLGYEELDSDLELEIFGIKFNLEINSEYLEKLKELQYTANSNDDKQMIKDVINGILGFGAYDKIRDKYKADRGKDIDEFVWLKVAMFVKKELENYLDNYGNEFKVSRPMNRNERRYNNRRYNNRRYRRY